MSSDNLFEKPWSDSVVPPQTTNETPLVEEETLQANTEMSVKDKARQLVSQLKRGKSLHDSFAVFYDQEYKIDDKILAEWREYFKLEFPPDLNPRTAIQINSKLTELTELADYHKKRAQRNVMAQKANNQKLYRESFTRLVTEYKSKKERLPARDTLAALAEQSIEDELMAATHAEIAVSFWKDTLILLASHRKALENATLNLSVEAKALRQDIFLDNLNKK